MEETQFSLKATLFLDNASQPKSGGSTTVIYFLKLIVTVVVSNVLYCTVHGYSLFHSI